MDALLASIPGYREAVERENAARETAFLDVPVDIAGVDCVQLTPARLILLHGIESPFICGGMVSPAAVAAFLWIVSVDFKPGDTAARDAFVKRIRKTDAKAAIDGIRKYLDDALMDAPTNEDGAHGAPVVSFTASVVHALAKLYHWSERDILNIPLARIWQYLRLARRDADPKAIFVNPSGRIIGDWLAEQNQSRERN